MTDIMPTRITVPDPSLYAPKPIGDPWFSVVAPNGLAVTYFRSRFEANELADRIQIRYGKRPVVGVRDGLPKAP